MKNPVSIASALSTCALSLCVLSVAPAATAESVLYIQNFDNIAGSGTRTAVNEQFSGWNSYISKKAVNMADRTFINQNNDAEPPTFGQLQSYSYSMSTTVTPGYMGGFLGQATTPNSGSQGSPIMAAVYTGLSIDIASYTDLNISWQGNASAAGPLTRLLLQVDGQWYATDTAFTLLSGGAADLDKASHTFSYSFSEAASAWREFTLTPSTITDPALANGTMSVGTGTLAESLSGTITGIGIYTAFATDGTNSTVRYDQLKITGAAIPEPLHAGLLLGLLAAGAVVYSRRKSS